MYKIDSREGGPKIVYQDGPDGPGTKKNWASYKYEIIYVTKSATMNYKNQFSGTTEKRV